MWWLAGETQPYKVGSEQRNRPGTDSIGIFLGATYIGLSSTSTVRDGSKVKLLKLFKSFHVFSSGIAGRANQDELVETEGKWSEMGRSGSTVMQKIIRGGEEGGTVKNLSRSEGTRGKCSGGEHFGLKDICDKRSRV